MASETKSELVDELSSQSTKAELVELLGSRLKKDEISKLLDDDSGGTKEELLRKLGLRKKDELIQAVETGLTKDEIEKAVEAVREDSADDDGEDESESERSEPSGKREKQADQKVDERQESRDRDSDDSSLDWNAALEWAPAPRPTPAPVAYAGAPPFLPGSRVRVDLSGLPTLGVFAGKGASAAGTVIGVDAHEREVRVYLDACFSGEREIVLPPERVLLDR